MIRKLLVPGRKQALIVFAAGVSAAASLPMVTTSKIVPVASVPARRPRSMAVRFFMGRSLSTQVFDQDPVRC